MQHNHLLSHTKCQKLPPPIWPGFADDPHRLCLALHDELYLVDLAQTLYFMADDHYTHILYASGVRFMVPFGLSRIEERLALHAIRHPHPFLRLGRKYIVNLAAIHAISTTKQQLTLLALQGKTVTIPVSKPVLRDLLSTLGQSSPEWV